MIWRSKVARVKVKGHMGQVKGHMGQGQRSHGSRPNITLNIDQKGEGYRIKVKGHNGHGQVMITNKGRWAHINVTLLHSVKT